MSGNMLGLGLGDIDNENKFNIILKKKKTAY